MVKTSISSHFYFIWNDSSALFPLPLPKPPEYYFVFFFLYLPRQKALVILSRRAHKMYIRITCQNYSHSTNRNQKRNENNQNLQHFNIRSDWNIHYHLVPINEKWASEKKSRKNRIHKHIIDFNKIIHRCA